MVCNDFFCLLPKSTCPVKVDVKNGMSHLYACTIYNTFWMKTALRVMTPPKFNVMHISHGSGAEYQNRAHTILHTYIQHILKLGITVVAAPVTIPI